MRVFWLLFSKHLVSGKEKKGSTHNYPSAQIIQHSLPLPLLRPDCLFSSPPWAIPRASRPRLCSSPGSHQLGVPWAPPFQPGHWDRLQYRMGQNLISLQPSLLPLQARRALQSTLRYFQTDNLLLSRSENREPSVSQGKLGSQIQLLPGHSSISPQGVWLFPDKRHSKGDSHAKKTLQLLGFSRGGELTRAPQQRLPVPRTRAHPSHSPGVGVGC